MAITRCPKCKEEIDHLDYTAQYTTWGSENGTISFCGDMDMHDQHESSYENDDISYICPKCNYKLDCEDLENLDAIESDCPLPYPDRVGYDYCEEDPELTPEDIAKAYNEKCFIADTI